MLLTLLHSTARMTNQPLLTVLALMGLTLISALLTACDNPSSAISGKGGAKARPAPQVEAATVFSDSRALRREENGTLEAMRVVRVFNQEEGRILTLGLREGDAAAAGQLLAQLDDSLIKAELDKTVAARRQAQLDLKRLERLPARLASEDALARARTALDLARAEEALQAERLSYMQIKAPFAGVISERLQEPGDVVPRYSHLLTLIDPQSLFIKVSVPEALLSSTQVGDAVDLRIDALAETRFPGKVSRIYPGIQASTRRGILEVKALPLPVGARAGQFCRVGLYLPVQTRLLIPFNALRHDVQGAYVYRIDEKNTVHRVGVRAGVQFDAYVQILQGLEAGQAVVSKGFVGLREGSPVTVLHAESSAPTSPAAQTD